MSMEGLCAALEQFELDETICRSVKDDLATMHNLNHQLLNNLLAELQPD